MSDLTDRLRWLGRLNAVYQNTDGHKQTLMQAADALDAAEAENAQLREDYGNLAAELGQVIVGYRQELAAIDALHQPYPHGEASLAQPTCQACSKPHPCPTHRILHPETER